MSQDPTPVWVHVDGGDVFDGSWQMFLDEMFLFGETPEEARAWAARQGWTLELFDFAPGANGRRIPATAVELGAALREYAARGHAGGSPQVVVDHLWRMADAVDGGRGALIHHGCPDPTIPTAQCAECHLVLDVEVDNAPGRDGTVFDPALAS